jgi:outer membrane protein
LSPAIPGALALAAALAAPVLVPGAALAQTLPEAVEMALAGNPGLAAQRAQLEATSERRVQAAAVSRATLSAEASLSAQESWSRSRTLAGTTTDEISTVTRPGQVALAASQPIWLAGRGSAAAGEADARVAQAEARYRGAAIAVIRDVVTAYADLRRDSRALDIRRSNLVTLTRQLDAARARFEVGEITRTDVAQVEARQAAARASLSLAESRLGASRAAIERLIGQPPAQLAPVIAEAGLPATLEQAVLAARASNPDLDAARAGQRVAEQGARLVAAEVRPRATLTASGARSVDQGFDGNTGGSVALQARVTVPLYSAGANASRVREANGGARAARLSADDAERQVVERITNGWRQLEAARQGLEATTRQVAAARIAFEGAELEQSVGLRTTLDVLIQQQELLEAELALAGSERDVVVAAYGLAAGIGTLSPQAVGLAADAVPAPQLRPAPTPLIVEVPLIAVQRGLDAIGRARVVE